MPEPTPARPRLVPVAEAAGATPPGGPKPAESGARGISRPVFWLLAAVALGAVIGLYDQASKVRSLTRENAALTGELFTARTALDAYTARFSEVRESVAGLQARLAELEVLVNEDPVTGAAPATEPPEVPGN